MMATPRKKPQVWICFVDHHGQNGIFDDGENVMSEGELTFEIVNAKDELEALHKAFNTHTYHKGFQEPPHTGKAFPLAEFGANGITFEVKEERKNIFVVHEDSA